MRLVKLCTIHRGNYADVTAVQIVKHGSRGERVAMKWAYAQAMSNTLFPIYNRDGYQMTNALTMMNKEIRIILLLRDSPGICKIKRILNGPRIARVLFAWAGVPVMVWNRERKEYCATGGMVENLLPLKVKPAKYSIYYSESDAFSIIKQVVCAVSVFHSMMIVHKDIKPENVLITKSNGIISATLCDFNSADIVDSDGMIFDCQGTEAFSPPELFSPGKGVNGFARDMWSVGMTLYCLLFGRLPFVAESGLALQIEIMGWQLSMANSMFGTLLEGLLCRNPSQRMTADQALDWLKSNPLA